MGGYGSGRTGGHPTVEACDSWVLDLPTLKRAGLTLKSGKRGEAELRFGNGAEIQMEIDTRSAWPTVKLTHWTRTYEPEVISYPVSLEFTTPPFGGERCWFLCPSTRQRVWRLVLPSGGRWFLSRRAYSLGYECQRVTPEERLRRRARKLRRRLGDLDGCIVNPVPDKPKGMWWSTYDRLVDELDRVEDAINGMFVDRSMKLFKRLGVSRPRMEADDVF